MRRSQLVNRGGVEGLIVMMIGLSALLVLELRDQESPVADQPWVTWWLLLPMFALAEIFVVHLPTSRGAHTHSLREVPNVLGLAFLSPLTYLAAHLVGTGSALLLHRHQRGSKLAFNLALFALEVLVGVATYRLLLGSASPADPRGWAAAVGATVVTDLISAVLITAAIVVHEREFDRSIITQSLTRGTVAAGANTCLASLVIVLVILEPSALPLLLVVLLVLFVTYRAYVSLWVGHTRVRQLYAFVQETGSTVSSDELVAAILREARDIMRASTAELVLVATDGTLETRLVLAGDTDQVAEAPLRREAPTEWWYDAAKGSAVLTAVSSCPEHGTSCRGGVAAPVTSADSTVSGVLLVHDRTVEVDPFSAADADLFSTVAAHASVALDNARMFDRLREHAAEREHQALHDTLTGLPNRLSLVNRLAEGLEGGTAAVVLVGIDDVERVNEVLGHAAGEALVRLVADRFQDVQGRLVCQLDGTTFAVVLAGAAAAGSRECAERLLAALRRPLLLGDVPLYATGRAGIACAPLDGAEAQVLLRHALAALHAAAPGSVTFAHQAANGVRDGERRLTLAADLSVALDSGGLAVWYQPQVDARTHQLRGAEALLRWEHPMYESVPANEIIDVAERTGQLFGLTEFVLAAALAQRSAWLAEGIELTVSVNMAPQILHDDSLIERVTRHLWDTHTTPGSLVIEVTESGVMTDPDRALQVLHEFTELGVEISIDDFGTGHSSLAYLDRLPVSEVKIDRSFVQPLDRGLHDSPVLRSTVALAHEIGLRVVAEGVETQLAESRLQELGCDRLQGYLIGRPMPAGRLGTWLDSRRNPAREGRQVP